MRATVIHSPGDIRVENLPDPEIQQPTDAVIRTIATCVCGSDLWDYRGINPVTQPTPMGHEYAGIVEQVGAEVTNIKPGQFVIGSFFASDNTCPNCRNGYQTSCLHSEFIGGAQAEYIRIPLADGTLVPTPTCPPTSTCPACSPARTSWAPAGTRPPPPGWVPARVSRSSATARSDCAP